MIKFFEQKNLAAFKIFGADVVRYLNGRITQDIKSLAVNEARLSLILSPQGKAEGKFSITKKEDYYLVIAETSGATSDEISKEVFIKNLLRFKVSDQVYAESFDTNQKVFTLFDNEMFDHGALEKLEKNPNFSKIKRGESLTFDFVTDLAPSEYIKANDEEYLEFRIRSKFPIVGADIGPKVSGTDIPLADYVSFTKGCYAGQEVVEMSQARGRANKKLVFISGENISLNEDNLKVYLTNSEDTSKEIGFITSYLNIKSGFVALGFVKSDVDFQSKFSILTESNTVATINVDVA